MPSSTPLTDDPLTRGTNLLCFKVAARRVFGDAGFEDLVARLPDATKARTISSPVLAREMYPEDDVMAWYAAALEGPAGGSMERFREWVRDWTRDGFGTVRALILAVVTPKMLAEKVSELWRYDHTTGVLTCVEMSERTGHVVLEDHIYGTTEVSREAILEVLTTILQLTRFARQAKGRYEVSENRVDYYFEW